MHLVTFDAGAGPRLGVLHPASGELTDLWQAAPHLPRDMVGLIRAGAEALEGVRTAAAAGAARRPAAEVRLLAPLPHPPRNILCVGKNYRDHVAELRGGLAADSPSAPIFFTKATTTVIGPGAPIPAFLDPTHTVDYEGELAVVIGTGGRGISPARVMAHVFGYTIVNDVTSRRLQTEHGQWFLGKSVDGFCPMGPAIVTADAVEDVGTLRVLTRVNGELRQDGRVADMIFDLPALIAAASRTMTLEPGDIIATGTPAGVGMGFSPPRYLAAGDRVTIILEPIGTLSNPVA